MRLRLGERTTKRKPGKVSNSNNLQIKGKWWWGDLRSRFSSTYSSYSSLLLSSFCSTKTDQDRGSLFLWFSLPSSTCKPLRICFHLNLYSCISYGFHCIMTSQIHDNPVVSLAVAHLFCLLCWKLEQIPNWSPCTVCAMALTRYA